MAGAPGAAFGIDLDRVGAAESAWQRVRRRVQGRYPVDAFGGDPLFMDAVAGAGGAMFSFTVDGEEGIPEIGAATFVLRRRPGPGDAIVLRAVIRAVRRRRARIIGYPDYPVVGGAFRRAGYTKLSGEDLAVCLRAGHLAIVRAAQVPVLWGAIGFPLIPVVVRGGVPGPFALPFGRHRVNFGHPLDLDLVPRDPLSAAELGAAATDAVQGLLDRTT